ncbi:MAG: TonB-dependent receptor [Acidobacteria bacterium]|nr:TonB-dependent receptor [Acidobacteriota bacterium]MCB9378363.1 TonB-dependent receptor [Holophagales bacterium]
MQLRFGSPQAWAMALALLCGSAPARAQGVQTGTVVGDVTGGGSALPGVLVTARSASAPGERTAVTGATGEYVLRGLIPGDYTVTFALDGMRSVERRVAVTVGATARADAAMDVQEAAETLVVLGESPSVLESTTTSATFEAEEIDTLSLGQRDLDGIAALAPGLTGNTPNAGQLTISGAFAYDNVFLVDGVDINDNLFGSANNLFIEDAIDETQVLTSGISAEYGRFSGGVINAVTKSGGNVFAGSLRADYSKPDWRDETPFEKERGLEREGDLSTVYQATLGGPILRDRLWFFLAGRSQESDVATTRPLTGVPAVTGDSDDRYQVKLTANVASNHTLQATYTDVDRVQSNQYNFSFSIDPRTAADRELPNDGFAVSWSGVLTNTLFAEARYSEKNFGFRNSGGTSTALEDSPFLTLGNTGLPAFYHYNGRYFDSTDPEDRNNEQAYGALSWFSSSDRLGSHDLKGGYERFVSTRTGGNSQSASNFVYYTDYRVDAAGNPVYDADGRLSPIFVPGSSEIEFWYPERGARIDIQTDSLFVNDRWDLSAHWSANLGLRYERVTSDVSGGANITTLDTDAFAPRLGLSFDPRGDGRYKINVTYAEYAGKYSESQFAENTNVGNPSALYGYYVGPACVGIDCGAGLDVGNYVFYDADVPTANILVDPGLSSPKTREVTIGGAADLGNGGYLQLVYVDRSVSDFVEDFITLDNGKTLVELGGFEVGEVDNVRISNSDLPQRDYRALQLAGRYRLTDDWWLAGNWTWQLENDGNFEGEATNQPGISSGLGDRPEVYPTNRFDPTGRLNDYQEHRVRLWSTYGLDFGRAGTLDVGLLAGYDSPLTFSYTATFGTTPEQRAADPGYASLPNSDTLYFGRRGAGEYAASWFLDLGLTYRIPVWRTLEPWIKVELFNLTNADTLQTFNTAIAPNRAGPRDAYGLPTQFSRSSAFGSARSASDYQTPREYRFSVGLRF